MSYAYAKMLHNDDEVTIKGTGETVRVISTEVYDKDVFIYAMTQHGYTRLHHRHIR